MIKRLVLVSFLFFTTLLHATETDSFELRKNGSLPVWLVAGPFPNEGATKVHGDNCSGYFKDYLTSIGGESQTVPSEGEVIVHEDMKVTWKSVLSDTAGLLDFVDIFRVDTQTPGVGYAFAELYAENEKDVVFRVRSDDGVRVWLNSELIHDHHVGRGVEDGEDRVPARLRKGENALLVKVDQGDGGWGLQLRVKDPGGAAAKDIANRVELERRLTGTVKSAEFHYLPPLLNDGGGIRNEFGVVIESGGLNDLTCRVEVDEWSSGQRFVLGDLPVGTYQFILEVPEITDDTGAEITLEAPGYSKTYQVDIDTDPGFENETAIHVDGLEEEFTVLHVTDSHISIFDESEAAYHAYAKRMDEAYKNIKHYKTGLKADPEDHFLRLLWTAARHNPDLIVLTGDIVNNPSRSSVAFVKNALDSTGIPYLYISGNHDWHYEGLPGSKDELRSEWIEKSLKPLYNGRNPLYYQVIRNGVKFIAIDNSTYEISPEQLAFFKSELEKGLPTVLMMHIPIEDLESNTGEKKAITTKEFQEKAENAPNLLGILCGHIHVNAVDELSETTKQYVTALGANGHYRLVRFKEVK